MPTYDYQCEACGHAFELFQSITAPVQRKCPKCGKPRLRRLIGAGAGVLFKGGGFYETDYRSDSYKKAAEADKKAAEPATESKAETKSESKSAKVEASSSTPANPKSSAAPPKREAGSKPSKRKK